MTAVDFHAEALFDLDEEFIRADNIDAADRVITELLSAIRGLVRSPIEATNAPTSPLDPCASFWCVNT
jgi:hypothetical protein